MSILTAISYYTSKALDALGVKNKETPSTDSVQKSSAAIIQPKTEEVGDKLVKNQINTPKTEKSEPKKEKNIKHHKNKRSTKEIKQSIMIKCQKYGFEPTQLLVGVNKSLKTFAQLDRSLSEKERERAAWETFETIIDSAIEVRKKYGCSPKVSLETVVIEIMNAYEKDIKEGNVYDIKNAMTQAGDINAELGGKDFDKKSIREQNRLLNKSYSARRKKRNAEINAELSKYPKSQRAKKRKELEAQLNFEETVRLAQYTGVHGPESGYRGLRLVSPNNMHNGMKMVTNSIKDEKDKQKFIDETVTMDSEMELYDDYYERGEKPDGNAVQDFHSFVMSQKSGTEATAYHQSYVNARKSGKYQRLERDGIFTNIAAGNLSGTQLNTKMSVAERVALVKELYQSEAQFGDVDIVSQKANEIIEKYLVENPEAAKNLSPELEEIRKQTQTSYEKALQISKETAKKQAESKVSVQKENEAVEKANYTSNTADIQINQTAHAGISVQNAAPERKNSSTNPITSDERKLSEAISSKNPNAILYALSTGKASLAQIVEKAQNREQIYQIIFSNNNLISLYETEAIQHIKNLHREEDLLALANSSKAIELILNNNTLDNTEGLQAKLEKKASSTQKYLFKDNNGNQNENYKKHFV